MTIINAEGLPGQSVNGSGGEKLGKVEEIYFDNETGTAEWAAVKTGMFGKGVSLVPLAHATQDGSGLTVPYDKSQIKDSPHHDPGHELSRQDEAELFQHYGIDYEGATVTASEPRNDAPSGNGDVMTRSEEQMHVGTEKRESGKVRLRKYVVTENVTKTVPVSHEEVRIEREPFTDANRPEGGVEISEETQEVTLHEEHAVVGKETVGVEQVRLSKQTVEGEETVEADLRKERIDQEPTSVRPSDRS